MYTLEKMLYASTCSGRCKQHPHNKRDVDCFLTCPKQHTACTHEESYWIHQNVQGGDIRIYTDRMIMSFVTQSEQQLQHTYVRNDIERIKSEGKKLTASTQTERYWLITYILKGKFSFTRGQPCWMHPSEQREVNCIHTNREVLTVFILANRSTACIHKDRCWMHQHVQREVNCLRINREMLTVFLQA